MYKRQLYKSADYTLDNAKEDGEDGFTVDVTVKPFLIFEGLDDELNAKLEEIAANMTEVPSDEEINEMVYQAMYDIISPKPVSYTHLDVYKRQTFYLMQVRDGVFGQYCNIIGSDQFRKTVVYLRVNMIRTSCQNDATITGFI